MTSLPEVPCNVLFEPEPTWLKTKCTLSVAPKPSVTVIVTFDGQRLDPSTTYEAVIEESRKELARVRIDLGKLR